MNSQLVGAFRRGLAENGCAEGRNITVEYSSGAGDQYDQLPALAAELTRRPVLMTSAAIDSAYSQGCDLHSDGVRGNSLPKRNWLTRLSHLLPSTALTDLTLAFAQYLAAIRRDGGLPNSILVTGRYELK